MGTRNVVPRADGEGTVGTAVKKWLGGFFDAISGGDGTFDTISGGDGTFDTIELSGMQGSYYAADAEASDTYVITLSPIPTAYFTGMEINFKANTANTGAATINVNALGAKPIKKQHDKDLVTGDIESGQIVKLIYDGTNFQMQSQLGNSSVTSAANIDANAIVIGDDGAAGVKKSVATISGTGGIVTAGTIQGKNKEIFKTANADSPLTAEECAGTIVSNYGMTDADCTIDLPTAVEGLAFVCILPAVRARFFKLHCPTAQADKIYLLGVAGLDDGSVGVASGYGTGSTCSFFTFKASDGGYDWFAIPLYGTWVAS